MPRKQAAKIGRIEDDTPILPYAVADSVINEVDRCVPLHMSIGEQRALVDKLADHADAIYARNESFRKKIRGRGDTGRDYLYAFMRHWLSSELKKTRPHVFEQLPQSFMNGEELYCGNLRPSFAVTPAHATKKKPAQLQREIDEALATPAWAKGLDLSESRALAQRLGTVDVEAKQRRIESDRRAALPSLSITDAGDGIFVRVSSRTWMRHYHAVVDALKAFQIPIGNAIPPNIFVPVHKAADKTKARTKVEEALRYAGYRTQRSHSTKRAKAAKEGLPVRDDVTEVEYHRPPTASEIRFGHGAAHYRTFPVEDAVHPETRVLKKSFVASDDGLRYYR